MRKIFRLLIISYLMILIEIKTIVVSIRNTKLPKRHGGGRRHIERIDPMRHRDTNYIVRHRNRIGWKPLSLRSHHNGQPRFGRQDRIGNGDRIVRKCHGGGAEAVAGQITESAVQPRPGNQKDRTHGHPDRTTVQRIARVTRQQHGIHPEGGRRTKNGTNIRSVHHTVDDDDAPGIPTCVFHRAGCGATHGTQHSARQDIARQRSEQLPPARIDGHVAATTDDVGGITGDVFLLAQEGQRFISGIQCYTDHLRAFGYEQAFIGLDAVAQLGLGEGGEHLDSGVRQGGYFNNGHKAVFFLIRL